MHRVGARQRRGHRCPFSSFPALTTPLYRPYRPYRLYRPYCRIALDDPLQVTLANNYTGTSHVLELAATRLLRGPPRFVHVSSAYVNINQPRGSTVEERIYPLKFGDREVGGPPRSDRMRNWGRAAVVSVAGSGGGWVNTGSPGWLAECGWLAAVARGGRLQLLRLAPWPCAFLPLNGNHRATATALGPLCCLHPVPAGYAPGTCPPPPFLHPPLLPLLTALPPSQLPHDTSHPGGPLRARV